mmetsp:Transcript_39138/g.76357  ORF Transcript_39138/g.76357 Transcript_39138/m.76357 type:complete len:238 (-) Transcript_39138:192-905(-)
MRSCSPLGTILSMISPVPRTSRIRPVSGSRTSRTRDRNSAYSAGRIGAMARDLSALWSSFSGPVLGAPPSAPAVPSAGGSTGLGTTSFLRDLSSVACCNSSGQSTGWRRRRSRLSPRPSSSPIDLLFFFFRRLPSLSPLRLLPSHFFLRPFLELLSLSPCLLRRRLWTRSSFFRLRPRPSLDLPSPSHRCRRRLPYPQDDESSEIPSCDLLTGGGPLSSSSPLAFRWRGRSLFFSLR